MSKGVFVRKSVEELILFIFLSEKSRLFLLINFSTFEL